MPKTFNFSPNLITLVVINLFVTKDNNNAVRCFQFQNQGLGNSIRPKERLFTSHLMNAKNNT